MTTRNNVVAIRPAAEGKAVSPAKGKAQAPAAPALKGKRLTAYGDVRPASYRAGTSRKELIAIVNAALGSSPSDAEVKAVKRETIIGQVAVRLPASIKGDAARLSYAEQVVVYKAKPATDGCKPIRAYQVGRRTPTEHKMVRAAEQMASQLFAELGRSNAQTQAEAVAKRKPRASTENTSKGAAPTAAEIAEKVVPMTQDGFVNHVQTQLAALIQFSKKHAKHVPTEMNIVVEGLAALKQVSNNAANEYQVRKARG